MSADPTADDLRYMKRALQIAARGRYSTRPNPMVGAVIVKRRRVVAEAFHRRAGQAHAEILALQSAGSRARGSTLYVNLEPCCHYGKTPPCTTALIAAGIKRVVVGIKDANPVVNGKGIRLLRQAGIQVDVNVARYDSERLNEVYFCAMRTGLPHITVKSAVTIDGKTATAKGESRWITSSAARIQAHRLRRSVDAISVGVGTVIADNPQLTCRLSRVRSQPLRVVFDSHLRSPLNRHVFDISVAPTVIVTTMRAPTNRIRQFEKRGVRVIRCRSDNRRISLDSALLALTQIDVQSLLVEGGPTLSGAFFDAQLIQRVVVFVAPTIIGDPQAKPMFVGRSISKLSNAVALEDTIWRRTGPDWMLSGRPRWSGPRRS